MDCYSFKWTSGLLTDSARSINVNANGWEVDQTFIKGIIGGMCVDQIVNNYLDACQLDSGTRRADNDNGILASGKTTPIWNISGMKLWIFVWSRG